MSKQQSSLKLDEEEQEMKQDQNSRNFTQFSHPYNFVTLSSSLSNFKILDSNASFLDLMRLNNKDLFFDKSKQLYYLLKQTRPYFTYFQPRRFGKTFFLSMIQYFLERGVNDAFYRFKKRFPEAWLSEQHLQDISDKKQPHLVVRLSFNVFKFDRMSFYHHFKEQLLIALQVYEYFTSKYKSTLFSQQHERSMHKFNYLVFKKEIEDAKTESQLKCTWDRFLNGRYSFKSVLLIDQWDYPVFFPPGASNMNIQTIKDLSKNIVEEMIDLIVLKNAGGVQFIAITGVIKLESARGFSGNSNSSTDLSFSKKINICGISQQQLRDHIVFRDVPQQQSQKFIRVASQYFGRYNVNLNTSNITYFNPMILNSLLASIKTQRKISVDIPYWYDTSVAQRVIQHYHYGDLKGSSTDFLTLQDFTQSHYYHQIHINVLLICSGLATVSYNKSCDNYSLQYPSKTMHKFLLSQLAKARPQLFDRLFQDMEKMKPSSMMDDYNLILLEVSKIDGIQQQKDSSGNVIFSSEHELNSNIAYIFSEYCNRKRYKLFTQKPANILSGNPKKTDIVFKRQQDKTCFFLENFRGKWDQQYLSHVRRNYEEQYLHSMNSERVFGAYVGFTDKFQSVGKVAISSKNQGKDEIFFRVGDDDEELVQKKQFVREIENFKEIQTLLKRQAKGMFASKNKE